MLYYSLVPGALQQTNATPNTPNDCFFVTPGVARTMWVKSLLPMGRGGQLTSISGISLRLVKWTTTAALGGTALTPSPDDPGYQAAKQSAGWAAGTVTSGTGGPTLLDSVGMGAASPGQWMAPASLDEGYCLQAGATQSIDVENVSATASLNFEMRMGTVE